jgi:hypothetical protein
VSTPSFSHCFFLSYSTSNTTKLAQLTMVEYAEASLVAALASKPAYRTRGIGYMLCHCENVWRIEILMHAGFSHIWWQTKLFDHLRILQHAHQSPISVGGSASNRHILIPLQKKG